MRLIASILALMVATGCAGKGSSSLDTAAEADADADADTDADSDADTDADADADTSPPPPEVVTYAGCELEYTQDDRRDGWIDYRERVEYDDRENVVLDWISEDGDEEPESVTTSVYDEAGLLAAQEVDGDGDGAVDEAFYRSYDAKGRAELYEHDADNDGDIDNSATYAYDEAGNLAGVDYDAGNDGSADTLYRFTYDADGDLVEERITDAEGALLSLTTYTWGADRESLLIEEDYDGDGAIDGTTAYVLDEDGDVTSYVLTYSTGAVYDYAITYDAYNREIAARMSYVQSGDPQYDLESLYYYDAAGREKETLTDVDFDFDGEYDDYGVTSAYGWACPP